LLVPVPERSTAQGVVWLSEDGYARPGTDCFVEKVLVAPGSVVAAGTALVECTDPLLEARLRLAEATLAELEIKRLRARQRNRNQGQVVDDEIRVAQERVDSVRAQRTELTVRSPILGVFVLPTPADWPGRFVPQGETIGYVLHGDATDVRVAIEQADIGRVRRQIDRATVRFADRPNEIYDAQVRRMLPGANRTLPSAALGTSGGGSLAVDSGDAHGRTAIEPVFQLELRLTGAGAPLHTGGRAYVRLEHGSAPLASQAYERLRQLLLKRLAV
jgi:putative peptide zinc metalloprotease protein